MNINMFRGHSNLVVKQIHDIKCYKLQIYFLSVLSSTEANSIFFDPFYFKKLTEDSIIDSQTVNSVEECADLCLQNRDVLCTAFDVQLDGEESSESSESYGSSSSGLKSYECYLASDTYQVLNTTDEDDIVHFSLESFPGKLLDTT